MDDVKDLLVATAGTVLENFYLQGTAPAVYPDTFGTFWTNDVPDGSHFDNAVASYNWDFSVGVYGKDPSVVKSKSEELLSVLSAAGFIPQGRGRDIPSDKAGWTGWGMDFIYPERI